MSDICPAAGVIQSNSALALPCDHGKKLAKVNGTVAIAIDLVDLESLIKRERENEYGEYQTLDNHHPFSNPTQPLSDTREKHTLLRGLGVLPCHLPVFPCCCNITYHILKLGLGGVQVERTHNSAKFLGGNAAVTVLVKESESFLELCNLLFGKLVSLKRKSQSE